jgi:hypothetical protein
MSNIDKYAQFISQQKAKDDFGYQNPISESSMKKWERNVVVHFHDVGGKPVESKPVTVDGKAYNGNPSPEQIHSSVKKHPTVTSHANENSTSVKGWEVK